MHGRLFSLRPWAHHSTCTYRWWRHPSSFHSNQCRRGSWRPLSELEWNTSTKGRSSSRRRYHSGHHIQSPTWPSRVCPFQKLQRSSPYRIPRVCRAHETCKYQKAVWDRLNPLWRAQHFCIVRSPHQELIHPHRWRVWFEVCHRSQSISI